jgi:ATP-dependent helicase/DNAse subunit B
VKTPAVMKKLAQFTSNSEESKSLSASSLNTYINCPLQFYLTRVESIEEADEVTETIENNTFGTIFHAVLENIYKPFNGQIVNSSDLDELIKNKLNIEREIKRAFAKEFFKRKNDENITLEGNLLLIYNVIQKYVIKLLNSDKNRPPFKYVESEKRCHIRFPFSEGEVNIKGFIDRVDEKDGHIHIIDYKTGAGSLDFKNLDDVFNPENEKRPKYVLQTFLYGLLYKQYADGKTMIPGIYYIRNLFGKDFDIYLHHKPDKNMNNTVDDFGVYEAEFSEKLRQCIDEIFDPTVPFGQTKVEKNCEYCQYKAICNR